LRAELRIRRRSHSSQRQERGSRGRGGRKPAGRRTCPGRKHCTRTRERPTPAVADRRSGGRGKPADLSDQGERLEQERVAPSAGMVRPSALSAVSFPIREPIRAKLPYFY